MFWKKLLMLWQKPKPTQADEKLSEDDYVMEMTRAEWLDWQRRKGV
jgi:hypothetical protein